MGGAALGTSASLHSEHPWVTWVGALGIGVGLAVMGIQVWRGQSPHFQIVPQRWISASFARTRGNVFLTGAATVLLPCGWLHAFVLGALASGSPVKGLLQLLAFWIGTLPALFIAPQWTNRWLRRWSGQQPKIAGAVLILAALLSVGGRLGAIRSVERILHPQAEHSRSGADSPGLGVSPASCSHVH